MKIRRAEKRDIGRLIELLRDVLEVHAAIRPDIFITGTTKYSASDLEAIIADDLKPVYDSHLNYGARLIANPELRMLHYAVDSENMRKYFDETLLLPDSGAAEGCLPGSI